MFNFLNKKPAAFSSAQPQEVSQKLKNEKPLVLDVREPGEYAQGHIKGSKLIPLGQLPARLAELGDKEREIVTVCRSGARSSQAATLLAARGYNVTNLAGGMMGWQSAGLPVQK
ncbi:MAG: rhodanese-like protein [Chloroflexi bacterium]|jgi:rhodanese-related sulfurtransferase|nr:rhodanese-like protein [Chloroflexota bacterium]